MTFSVVFFVAWKHIKAEGTFGFPFIKLIAFSNIHLHWLLYALITGFISRLYLITELIIDVFM